MATHLAATALAARAASTADAPRSSAARKAPVWTSPAPVVSTAVDRHGGHRHRLGPGHRQHASPLPRPHDRARPTAQQPGRGGGVGRARQRGGLARRWR